MTRSTSSATYTLVQCVGQNCKRNYLRKMIKLIRTLEISKSEMYKYKSCTMFTNIYCKKLVHYHMRHNKIPNFPFWETKVTHSKSVIYTDKKTTNKHCPYFPVMNKTNLFVHLKALLKLKWDIKKTSPTLLMAKTLQWFQHKSVSEVFVYKMSKVCLISEMGKHFNVNRLKRNDCHV